MLEWTGLLRQKRKSSPTGGVGKTDFKEAAGNQKPGSKVWQVEAHADWGAGGL